MTPALDRGWRKAARTLVQMAASGALTAAVTALSDGLEPKTQAFVAAGWLLLVTFLQNWAETNGAIATLLPTRTTVSAVSGGVAQATVGAAIEDSGKVVGEVLDITGTVVGEVTGHVDEDDTNV